MSSNEEIINVKLKKIQKIEEKKIKNQNICENIEEFSKLLKETAFEDFYEDIKQYTFKSSILSINLELATELYNLGL
jgi:hypothetical protein